MTITENQRRTLDLMAESAGWNWADVEELSYQMFKATVSGLTFGQARRLGDQIAAIQDGLADQEMVDANPH
jgi:hypothetical protein